jgi:hypothetical protein
VALGAVIIIVAAIVWSKRRSQSMGEDAPAGAEVSGATSPAASVGSSEGTAPEVGAAAPAGSETVLMPAQNPVPPVPPAYPEGTANGQVTTESPTAAEPGQPE